MELTAEQIQALKKEIEGIWTHLDRLEKQAEKEKQTNDRFSSSANETIQMLERMKQKVDTWEQESGLTASDDLNQKIDDVLIHANVKEALEKLKQQLGIR